MSNGTSNLAHLESEVYHIDETIKSLVAIVDKQQEVVQNIIIAQKLMQQSQQNHEARLSVVQSDVKKLEADNNQRKGGSAMIALLLSVGAVVGGLIGAASAVLALKH